MSRSKPDLLFKYLHTTDCSTWTAKGNKRFVSCLQSPEFQPQIMWTLSSIAKSWWTCQKQSPVSRAPLWNHQITTTVKSTTWTNSNRTKWLRPVILPSRTQRFPTTTWVPCHLALLFHRSTSSWSPTARWSNSEMFRPRRRPAPRNVPWWFHLHNQSAAKDSTNQTLSSEGPTNVAKQRPAATVGGRFQRSTSQANISPICLDGPIWTIALSFGVPGDNAEIISHAKFCVNRFKDFVVLTPQFYPF